MTIKQAEQDRNTWLQGLKEGDGVVVQQRGSMGDYIVRIERVTATQIIVPSIFGTARRFRRKNGVEVGKSYQPTIEPITDERRQRIAAHQNRNDFGSLCYRPDRLADDEIAVMMDALRKLRASKEAAQ